MTLNQLECFSALAQRLNFTQAADALFMTQPAMSRTISSLEQELGVQLFYRTSRSVSLTPAGSTFLRECPTILDSYRHSLESARLAQQGYVGQLSLGVLRDAFDPLVVDLCRAMKVAYPQVRVFLREYSHSELFRHFNDRRLDAVVNFGMDLFPGETEALVLSRNQQCAVVPADSSLAQRPHVRMEELRDETFIAMSRTASQPGHDFLWKMAADAGFVPNVVAEASYLQGLLMLVACGVGITTLTDDLAYLSQGRTTFVPLLGIPLSPHTLVWRRDESNPSLPFLAETARTLPKRGDL